MIYYLETNALRILNSKLTLFSSGSFTSALSIVELIAGLKKDFIVRKKVITNLFSCNLEIDWRLPEQIIVNSFSQLIYDESRINDLKRICSILIKSDSLDDFRSKCSKQSIQYDFDFFENYKTSLLNNFINTTIKGNRDLQIDFDLFKLKHSSNKEDSVVRNKRIELEYWQKHNQSANNSFTILAHAKLFASIFYGVNYTEEQEREIYDSYNGLASYYFEGFSYYTIDKMIQGSQPSKNDFFDLLHLVYLNNKTFVQLITNDKLLIGLGLNLWKDRNIIKSSNDIFQ